MKIRFTSSLQVTKAWKSYFHFTFTDVNDNLRNYTDQSQYDFEPLNAGFDLFIKIPISTRHGRLSINLLTSGSSGIKRQDISFISSGSTDPNVTELAKYQYPIVIDNIDLRNDPDSVKAKAAASGAMAGASSQRSVANIALMNSNANLAVGLDRLFCDYTYLAFLSRNWEKLPYARLLLDPSIEITLVPFSTPPDPKKDSFKYTGIRGFGYDPSCSPPSQFVFNDLACNFFSNYGDDYVTLWVSLGVNLLMFGVFYYMEKKNLHPHIKTEEEENKEKYELEKKKWDDPDYKPPADPIAKKLKEISLKTLSSVSRSFGLQYILVKMNANALKVLIFSFLDMYTMRHTWQRWIGLVFSVLNVIFYVAYVFLMRKFLLHLLHRQKEIAKEKLKQTTASGKKPEIFKMLPLHKLEYSSVGIVFDKLKAEGSIFEFCFPFVVLGRNILLALSVVFLSETGVVLPAVCSIIELVYLCYVCMAEMKANFVENYLEMANSLLYAAFCVMTFMSYQDGIDMDKLDAAMFVLLLVITAANVFFGVYAMAIMVYDLLLPILCGQTFAAERHRESKEVVKSKLPENLMRARRYAKLRRQEAEAALESLRVSNSPAGDADNEIIENKGEQAISTEKMNILVPEVRPLAERGNEGKPSDKN